MRYLHIKNMSNISDRWKHKKRQKIVILKATRRSIRRKRRLLSTTAQSVCLTVVAKTFRRPDRVCRESRASASR